MERRVPREIWVERVARWREGGQMAADFARTHGLKVDRLRHWRDAFERIGEDISETVERRPASLVVVRVHRPKFVRKDRLRVGETDIVVASPPSLPIERGLAGPGCWRTPSCVAGRTICRCTGSSRSMPARAWSCARSTICGWHAELAELVRPL